MTAEGVAIILGAVATLITAISTAIVLVTRREVTAARSDLAQVHILVNQNRTDALTYQQDLIKVLQENDIIVPRDQSTLGPQK